MNKLKLIIRYGKVGKLLHFVAFWALVVSAYSFLRLNNLEYNADPFLWITWLALLIILFNMGILAELDGYSRFQNYKQVKDQMFLNGFQERQLKPLLKSSCQREAAILAGDELGIGKEVRNYFLQKGYKWYHIIPDFVFNNQLFFFSMFFWRTTFFTPRYEPKVNYDLLELYRI
ncbi:MAG: hypothetical protein WBQ32_15355 [Ignavibacteriaceae bacterium]